MLTALLLMAQAAMIPMPEYLAGCWQLSHPNGSWAEECWTGSRGGMMMGSRRSGRGKLVDRWEWMRIARERDGRLILHRSINGEIAAAFTAQRAERGSVTFLNAAEDYPQRVRYRLNGDLLDVEGAMANGKQVSGITLRRVGAKPKK